jgi:hypothetical protein
MSTFPVTRLRVKEKNKAVDQITVQTATKILFYKNENIAFSVFKFTNKIIKKVNFMTTS